MIKKSRIYAGTLKWVTCFYLIVVTQVHALPPLSNGPLFLGGNISPNVIFTLDDSGSMHFEIMPGDLILNSVRYMFPRASGIYGAGDYANRVVPFGAGNNNAAKLRSSKANKIYYNPEITYLPWSNADRSMMVNADPTCAPHNPKNTAAGCRNLTVNNTQSARWLKSNGGLTSEHSKTFYPAVYFQYNSGDINLASSYTKVIIKSNTPNYTGGVGRLDCAAAPTCTYSEEIQNFANWYTYYRSRVLLARAGVGRAFAAQGNTMRVGFAAINKGSTAIDGISTPVIINGVRQFTTANKVNFMNNLYGHTIPAAGTPLLNAVDAVGKYYQRNDDKGPWSDTPGSSGGAQLECRQNYNILMTDGFWNGSSPGVGNADNSAGDSITNHSFSATPATYSYTPVVPYADDNSDTLADVAMHYWKKDLRADMDNKVPTSPANPAFWQHMSTFTVGLGVNGTLTALPTTAGGWPDPTTSSAAKIDDLWHAAVNGRGEFFSVADPTTFANALSSSLASITSRISSATSAIANSNSLMTNGRIYFSRLNSADWSGQLLSVPININANFSAEEWDAGQVSLAPDTVDPATRVIVTKGNTDGVEFKYANLTAAQKTSFNQSAAGNIDNCGPERVDFLRGDTSKEGQGGTFTCASAMDTNRFRVRATSLLGDIVNSSPAFVGRPNAGHSDVDHPGYAAFSADYKDRIPMVYVGANDGMLHGFNACIPGETPGCNAGDAGKEMMAYIPNAIFDNLSRLTDQEYKNNHRYFVDATPMVADVYTAPSWKTVLIGALGGGGKGYFALDVTNPTDTSQSAPTFTAANAANLLLWEFSNADDADMGYSYNLPSVNSLSSQARQMVKMENNQWAVVVGNGYNSDAGKAVLYILFIAGGEDGTWTIGTDYIKLIADVGSGNGLSTPTPFDSDGNGKADVIYAGDIEGNLWKFDVSDADPANWQVALGGLPLFVSGPSKPIFASPAASFHPESGQMILFATGKYLEVGDTTDTSVQSVYGIRDHNITATVIQSDLVEQVMTASDPRIGTQNLVTYSATVKGWYINFPESGERITGTPFLEDGAFVFNSIIPSVSTCDFGGDGYLYVVNYATGGMLPTAVFDLNRNGIVGHSDGLAAGTKIGHSYGGTLLISNNNGIYTGINTAGFSNNLLKTPIAIGRAGMRGRITWRELVQ